MISNDLNPEQEERRKHLIDAIKHIPTVDGFKVPLGFPVPIGTTLLVKKTKNQGNMVTEGGIMLSPTLAQNQVVPNTAIIYAVGTNCSELFQLGHKIIHNPYSNNEVMIKGEFYILMEQNDIIGILPPDSWYLPPLKSDSQIRREEKTGDWNGFKERKAKKDANDLDKKVEQSKKK